MPSATAAQIVQSICAALKSAGLDLSPVQKDGALLWFEARAGADLFMIVVSPVPSSAVQTPTKEA